MLEVKCSICGTCRSIAQTGDVQANLVANGWSEQELQPPFDAISRLLCPACSAVPAGTKTAPATPAGQEINAAPKDLDAIFAMITRLREAQIALSVRVMKIESIVERMAT